MLSARNHCTAGQMLWVEAKQPMPQIAGPLVAVQDMRGITLTKRTIKGAVTAPPVPRRPRPQP
jgi:hypothetical protein